MLKKDTIDLDKLKIMPDRVLVRFRDADYENMLLGKEIKKDDGGTVRLIIKKDWAKEMDARSTVFRRTADVIKVGSAVTGIEVGDTAIMDYKVDNDDSIVIGHDDIGKLVVCLGVTSYFTETVIRYANRLNPKDTIMQQKGEINSVSDILGVIRNGKPIAKEPYVFLEYKTAKEMMVSASGIIYEQTKKTNEYKIISVSDKSKEKYFLFDDSIVLVDELDTFHVELPNQHILICNDVDVKLSKHSLNGLNFK